MKNIIGKNGRGIKMYYSPIDNDWYSEHSKHAKEECFDADLPIAQAIVRERNYLITDVEIIDVN